VLKHNTPILLYFDKMKQLGPAAALVLVSEIYRCRQLRKWRGGTTVTGTYPESKEIFLLLREMGFYKVLAVDEHWSIPDGRPKKGPYFIPFRTMNTVHPQLAASFCDVVAVGAFKMHELTQGRMVAAVKEAMLNAHEHAYQIRGEYDVMPKRWWLAGYVNPTTCEMMVMILDQGVGIPNTLDPTTYEKLNALLNLSLQPSDGNMIAAATELFRTSTGQSGRGRGFQDMKRFIDTCDDGELRVLSNGGAYSYLKGARKIEDFGSSIGGTLVQWRVRHGKTVEVSDE
jgi:anti-sigma regulatory factor (Ser/Thr protein kinase)